MQLHTGRTIWRRYFGGVALMVVLPLVVFATGHAQSSGLAQQYQAASSDITPAALVGLTQGDTETVELSQAGRENQLVGVVSNGSTIEFSGDAQGVQVVTEGLTATLVTDLNGDISVGDKITASPIRGVGMKALESGMVVGTARGTLDDATASTRTITDEDGNNRTVQIGLVAVQVGVSFFTADTGEDSFMPPFLQAVAEKIAGRDVSAMRVLAASLTALVVMVVVGALIYSSVRASIISIGRNPLSEESFRRSLFHASLTALGVLLLAGIAIYLILAF